ncbi:STAS domain-containing protein [Kitasatospora sp. NPDC001540]|uniref:STAS domain-containing protein n=1 Tax=Kitasatospora sp. NPDC001540 TaxID=3364014 RepID=UPI0036C7E9F2
MTDRTLIVDRLQHPSGVVVLSVTGELDQHTAPEFTRVVEESPFGPDRPAVIDLTELTYCDSTGITALVVAYNHAQDARAPFVIAGLNSDLTRVFQIVGLDQLFTFRPTLASALGSLERSG